MDDKIRYLIFAICLTCPLGIGYENNIDRYEITQLTIRKSLLNVDESNMTKPVRAMASEFAKDLHDLMPLSKL